mmetsp:Transcript_29786/g.68599  ORF Transcript_29786/g.68599 Transcript_29786/m.68599 type:complete len:845 (+) Transcript_29786:102-2636(+)
MADDEEDLFFVDVTGEGDSAPGAAPRAPEGDSAGMEVESGELFYFDIQGDNHGEAEQSDSMPPPPPPPAEDKESDDDVVFVSETSTTGDAKAPSTSAASSDLPKPASTATASTSKVPVAKAKAAIPKAGSVRQKVIGSNDQTVPPARPALPANSALSAVKGYIFICTAATGKDILSLQIFGACTSKLAEMREFITPATRLLLFNTGTYKLYGPFLPDGEPALDLVEGAFGGRFKAHIRYKSDPAMPLMEQSIKEHYKPGPREPKEMATLLSGMSKHGRLVTAEEAKKWIKAKPADAASAQPAKAAAIATPSVAKAHESEPAAKRVRLTPGPQDQATTATTSSSAPASVAGVAAPKKPVPWRQDVPGKAATPTPSSSIGNSVPRNPAAAAGGPMQPIALRAKWSGIGVPPVQSGLCRSASSSVPVGAPRAPTPRPPSTPPPKAGMNPIRPLVAPTPTVAGRTRLEAGSKPPADALDGREDSGETGYIFHCNNSTFKDCAALKLLGCPERELQSMKDNIQPNTPLFLLNMDSLMLVGTFIANGEPGQDLVEGAFGKKYTAHLHVTPVQPLLEVQLRLKKNAGPLSADDVKLMKHSLLNGQAASEATQAAWGQPRPESVGSMMRVLTGTEGLDDEGRSYNFGLCVVNFANVGASFADKVLRRSKGDRMFDWEGVRRCIKCLKEDLKLQVVGCVFENYNGPDNGKTCPGIPEDIRAACVSIQETPRLTGPHHKSADDEMTIKCAYRRNCRFLDNDNYRDWLEGLKYEKIRLWLQQSQHLLQMKYFFDTDLGTFDTLDGNIAPSLLVSRPNTPGTPGFPPMWAGSPCLFQGGSPCASPIAPWHQLAGRA